MNLTAILWEQQIQRALVTILSDARREILLSTFKMDAPPKKPRRPITAVMKELSEAQDRGVKVHILLNYNKRKIGTALHNKKTALWLSHHNLEAFFLPQGRCVHAKFIVVDTRLLLTGSHNLSNSSLSRNFEVSLLIRNPDIVRSYHDKFLYYFNKATPILEVPKK